MYVYDNIVSGKEKTHNAGMPVQKAERVELFSGLKYVSTEYYLFILQMEYVFMRTLTPEKLVMIGLDLITSVYNKLSANNGVRLLIGTFTCGGCKEADDNTLSDLVEHMTRV